MLTDARALARDARLDADVCIVGAGPAGITLACELLGSGLRTILVESGGLEADEETQSLAAGEIVSSDCLPALDIARARRFGGTSNLWDTRWDPSHIGFRGAPLDPIDFKERDWVPESGWPFDRAHLDPYYARAHVVGGMGPYDYDPARWESAEAPRLPVNSEVLETSIWHFGAQRAFLTDRRAELERAEDVTVLLNANVVELETAADGRTVSGVRALCLPDKPLGVRARVYVMAAGGIENARVLLLSSRATPSGLGNQNDLVGRYFMEHQMVRAGFVIPDDPALMDRMALYDERHVDGAPVMGKLQLAEVAMRSERTLNMAAALLPLHRHFRRHRWAATDAFSEFARNAREGRLPERPLEKLLEVVKGWDFVAARIARRVTGGKLFGYWDEGPSILGGGGWSGLPDKPRRFGALDVLVHVEQAPHPDNRVTLSDERDRLGCRRARLQWEWRALDIESMQRAQILLRDELAKSGIGRLEIEDCHGRPALIHAGLHHHIGTTRMHPDPRRGVVDEHSRVHGVDNLFMAGCSVFPTGGYINPTLTIMALAIRLGDRIKRQAETAPMRAQAPMSARAPEA